MFCVIVSFLADVYEGHPSTLWSLLTDKTQGGTGEGPSIYTTLLLLLMYVWVQASAKVSIPYGQSEKISFLATPFFVLFWGFLTSLSQVSHSEAGMQQMFSNRNDSAKNGKKKWLTTFLDFLKHFVVVGVQSQL